MDKDTVDFTLRFFMAQLCVSMAAFVIMKLWRVI